VWSLSYAGDRFRPHQGFRSGVQQPGGCLRPRAGAGVGSRRDTCLVVWRRCRFMGGVHVARGVGPHVRSIGGEAVFPRGGYLPVTPCRSCTVGDIIHISRSMSRASMAALAWPRYAYGYAMSATYGYICEGVHGSARHFARRS
jgi:hypothetical protein